MRIKKENLGRQQYGLASTAIKTKYFYNGKFLINLFENSSKGYDSTKENRRNVANILWDMRKNKGKWAKFHGFTLDTPFSVFDVAEERNASFQSLSFRESESGEFYDLSGNFNEFSLSFMFRIYDQGLIRQIKQKIIDFGSNAVIEEYL